ncbi:MAG: hypothetical protein V4643_12455 [Bacteroidota bacterium]
MKKTFFISIILISTLLSCNVNKSINVQYKLLANELNCKYKPHGMFKVFSDKNSLSAFLASDSLLLGCIHMNKIAEEFDFEKYDMLITFKGSISNITYLKNYHGKYDLCPELIKIPIQLEHNTSELSDEVCIYVLLEKNKYRTPCP